MQVNRILLHVPSTHIGAGCRPAVATDCAEQLPALQVQRCRLGSHIPAPPGPGHAGHPPFPAPCYTVPHIAVAKHVTHITHTYHTHGHIYLICIYIFLFRCSAMAFLTHASNFLMINWKERHVHMCLLHNDECCNRMFVKQTKKQFYSGRYRL